LYYNDNAVLPTNYTVTWNDSKFIYTFNGWNNTTNINPVVASGVYKANYSTVYIDYSVTFQFDNGTVMYQNNSSHYGDNLTSIASLHGVSNASHSFVNWTDGVSNFTSMNIPNVSVNVTYTAIFEIKNFTVIFQYDNGTIISQTEGLNYLDNVTIPTMPAGNISHHFVFTGWNNSSAINPVLGNAVYEAEFDDPYEKEECEWSDGIYFDDPGCRDPNVGSGSGSGSSSSVDRNVLDDSTVRVRVGDYVRLDGSRIFVVNEVRDDRIIGTVLMNNQRVEILLGSTVKVDYNNDGIYELEIGFTGIQNRFALLSFKRISEPVSSGNNNNGNNVIDEIENEVKVLEESGRSWVIWLVLVLVVLVICGLIWLVLGRRKDGERE